MPDFIDDETGHWYECDLSFDERGQPYFANPRRVMHESQDLIDDINSFQWQRCEPKMGGNRMYYPQAIDVESWEDEQRDFVEEQYNRELMRGEGL